MEWHQMAASSLNANGMLRLTWDIYLWYEGFYERAYSFDTNVIINQFPNSHVCCNYFDQKLLTNDESLNL